MAVSWGCHWGTIRQTLLLMRYEHGYDDAPFMPMSKEQSPDGPPIFSMCAVSVLVPGCAFQTVQSIWAAHAV